MCVLLQRFVVAQTKWFPLAESPEVVAAYEKRVIDAKGKVEKWLEKSGLKTEREIARAKLFDAAENFVIGRAMGWDEEGFFADLKAAVHAYKESGACL